MESGFLKIIYVSIIITSVIKSFSINFKIKN